MTDALMNMNLLSLTFTQWSELFRRQYAGGEFHAAAIYRAFFRDPLFDPETLPELAAAPRLVKRLKGDLRVDLPKIAGLIREDEVTKLALRLADGAQVESVVIPMPRHATVCISCQVGCRMGCRFCETGQMGLRRQLTAAEIVAQVYMIKVRLGINVRNVVFMGMGEPLDNFENVTQAIRVLEDQRGLNIAKRRITLSTAGLADGIRRLAALDWPQLKLAVSLNAAADTLRSRLMPVNLRHNLADLKQALQNYPMARGNVLLIEYVLIKHINDQPEHALQLAGFIDGLPVRLNLIAYNPRCASPFEAPGAEDLEHFRQALVDQHIFVRLRGAKGAGIRAACGQLGRGIGVCQSD